MLAFASEVVRQISTSRNKLFFPEACDNHENRDNKKSQRPPHNHCLNHEISQQSAFHEMKRHKISNWFKKFACTCGWSEKDFSTNF